MTEQARAAAVPPAETGREIVGEDAIAAISDRLQLFTAVPRVYSTLKDVEIELVAGKVLFTVKYRGKPTNEFTVRLSHAWAETVYGRLGRVLGK